MPESKSTQNQAPPLKWFKPSDFSCKCGCGQQQMSPDVLTLIDKARNLSGVPYVINSGRRCAAHNAAEHGSPTSSHLSGYAIDIAVGSDRNRGAILAGLITAGFRRIGIATTFIHVDIDPAKSGSVWLYS